MTWQPRPTPTPNGPRCTPVIDVAGSLVFTYGVEGKLHALDLKTGQCLWKRDILGEFQLTPNFFGVGATPLLEKNLLIVNSNPDEQKSMVELIGNGDVESICVSTPAEAITALTAAFARAMRAKRTAAAPARHLRPEVR